jgi:hypothetical protein
VRARVLFLTLTVVGSLCGQTLSGLVLSETTALNSPPDLAAWRIQHPDEQLKPAAFDNEYETQGLWCAASVSERTLSGGVKVTRMALFYVPPSANTLPAREDSALVQRCRLLAFWYEIRDPANADALVRSASEELTAALGGAEELPGFKRKDGDWGSGYWNPYWIWTRPNQHVILAFDPRGQRVLTIARASQAPHGLSFDWMGEAPKTQPSLRACAFDDGHNNWQDGLIREGRKLLRNPPENADLSYIHLTMARAYSSKLLLTYPGIDLDGANKPADPASLRRDAVEQYRAFLSLNPKAPEARTAWREAWRLLARLPPSPNHFACTD